MLVSVPERLGSAQGSMSGQTSYSVEGLVTRTLTLRFFLGFYYSSAYYFVA